MTAERPLTLVYQELFQAVGAAATPTLDVLIAGPAYHIQDYPRDRADILLSNYGSSTAASIAPLGLPEALPALNEDALILSDAPNNVVGAQLDHASVVVYLEDARIIVSAGLDGAFGITAPDENLFGAPGATFYADGVRAGDRLVFSFADGTTIAKTVLSVGGALAADELTTTTNFTTTGTSVAGAAYTHDGIETFAWRVEHTVGATTLDAAFIALAGNEITVLGGATVLASLTGTPAAYTLSFARAYLEYRALRTDLAKLTEISESQITTVLGAIDERNPLAAGAQVAFSNTPTRLKFFGVVGDDLNGISDVVAAYSEMLSLLESDKSLYAIVPLTSNTSVLGSILAHAEDFSSPEKAKFRACVGSHPGLPLTKTLGASSVVGAPELASGGSDPVVVFAAQAATWLVQGVAPKDKLLVVADATRIGTYTIKAVQENRILITEEVLAAGSTDASFYVLRNGGAVLTTLTPATVAITAANTITVDIADASPAHVGKVLRLTNAVTNNNASPLGNNDYLITSVAGAVYTVTGPALVAEPGRSGVVVSTVTAYTTTTVLTRAPFRQLLDTTASFISAGVVSGDTIQVSPLGEAENYTHANTLEAQVVSVLSDNRLLLATGTNIPTTDLATPGALTQYRVQRVLDKPGQRDALLSVVSGAGGYQTKRLILVWPDECSLQSVQNNKTQTKSRQPGYYLGCVVGGMTAGLPPHQGFTRIGVNGISQVYHSSRYFREDDLTALSNAGWYLFIQDTNASRPYSVHQLTTDTSDTRNAEWSMVKTFDWVSRFYKEIVDTYIGTYNVYQGTLDLLRGSLNSGSMQLMGQRLPKIGAPILAADIVSLSVLDGQIDHVEVLLSVTFPAPLNRISLRIVA